MTQPCLTGFVDTIMIWPCAEDFVEDINGATTGNRFRQPDALLVGFIGKVFRITESVKCRFVPWVAERRIRSIRRARGFPESPEGGFPTCDNLGV